MNPLVKRRLPLSVRNLLTNIGPKEEENWTDEEFLRPAESPDGSESETIKLDRPSTACAFCQQKPSCYTCPRCNLKYCGLKCYRDLAHGACSEDFYRESVLRELKEMGKSGSDERKKMQEILLGLQKKADLTRGGMESLLKEFGVIGEEEEETVGAAEKVQVVALLSRLAELQQSEEEHSAEVEAVLNQLAEIGSADSIPAPAAAEPAESDLATRLEGLDIDQLSEEELWELLNSKERESFVALMKSEDVSELVPPWKPWWEEHQGEDSRRLVEVLSVDGLPPENVAAIAANQQCCEVDKSQKVKQKLTKSKKQKETDKKVIRSDHVPPVSAKIHKLSSLCANPSPLLSYSLVNTLFSYAFSVLMFNGDVESMKLEFCETVLAISEALTSGRVFNCVQEALDSVENLIQNRGYLDREDPFAPARAVEAVAHILTGKDKRDPTGYCLAALSQLRLVLSQCRKGFLKEEEEGKKRRQQFFLACKKCEFYQAWVSDNELQIRRLALDLWTEHRKREELRNCMNKTRTLVEESLNKGKQTENDGKCLITELN